MAFSIALFQPDIPQNTATLLRMGACLDVPVEIIQPAGFALTDKNFRRAGMDYLDKANMVRHRDWEAFLDACADRDRRIILLTTKSNTPYTDFTFDSDDVLLFGRESVGAPDHVHNRADHRLTIPMVAEARSLNLAISAAMVTGEALRQLRSEA